MAISPLNTGNFILRLLKKKTYIVDIRNTLCHFANYFNEVSKLYLSVCVIESVK